MKIMLICSLFFLSVAVTQCPAQSFTKNLKWEVTQFYNEEVKESVTNTSRFESDSNKIKWIQKGGALEYDFDVNNIMGSWEDVSKDGAVTVEVSFRGNQGTIKFSRKQGVTTIETNIQVDGKNILPYTFTVTSISEL